MKKILGLIALSALMASDTAHALEVQVNTTDGVYHKTVRDWTRSLSEVGGVSSTSYLTKLHKGQDRMHPAGHRDVIYWIPQTTDLTRPFTMVVWFHGHHGFYRKRTFVNRTLAQLVPKAQQGKNFVLVLPEMPWSSHGKTPTRRNGRIWTKPGDFLTFIKESKDIVGSHHAATCGEDRCKSLGKIDYRIVGHSAGGSTIMRLGMTGDLCKINPSMVVWSDSSYGRWLDRAWDGCLSKSTGTVTKVFVQRWLRPWKSATRLMKRYDTPPNNLELYVKGKGWSHKLIGDNIVSLSHLLD